MSCVLLLTFPKIVKQSLYELESLTAGTKNYDDKIKFIMEHLRPHNDSEENKDLPQLEKFLGPGGSKEAAAKFKRTKKFVPTRLVAIIPS